MIYVRGNRKDYDDWESMGNEGWGYASVLKYFLKSEDNSNTKYLRTPFHSSGGYLSVEDVSYITPFVHAFIQAGEFLGYKDRDVNGKNQEGIMVIQRTTRKGSRWSASKAFIQPVQDRPNFHLSLHSYATHIAFESGPSGPMARTVSYTKDNKRYMVRARKEVIVSCGTINSPQLLMLSGIGPADHLKDLGIKVWKHLPVGYNLQDHPRPITLTFKVSKNVTLKPDVVQNPDALKEFFVKGSGPLSTTEGEVVAFLFSKYDNKSADRPSLYYEFSIGSALNNGLSSVISSLNLRPYIFDGSEYQKLDQNGNYFSILLALVRPKSRGRLTLRSKNPYEYPIINPNYFSRREEIEALVDGLQTMLKLVDSPPLKEYGVAPIKIPLPGCERLKLFSNEYFECIIRHYTGGGAHLSSTCAMGAGNVVDHRLRVHGVRSLRVIDASIMPFVVSGNTNAPTVMIAEKGADLIKEDWNALGKCPE